MSKKWFWMLAFWAPAFAVHAQIYRCGNHYQDIPCKGGRAVDTRPAMISHDGPDRVRIYLCDKPNGQQVWTNARCVDQGWALRRSESVSARASWEDQVREAQSRWQTGRQLRAEASAPRFATPAPSVPVQEQRQTCALLDERVKALDSMGRAGSLYYDLDWIRRERKAVRDEQFALRC